MSKALKFHHLGIAVADFGQAVAFYTQALGFDVISGPVEDPIQKVKLCFLRRAAQSASVVEIICPLERDSPVNGYLSKGIGAYHVCYEVVRLEETLGQLRSKGCLVISNPVPAVAFGGRKIAWCFAPTRQLIELLEEQTSSPGSPEGAHTDADLPQSVEGTAELWMR
jgi:methylmalonyl-CoA/ethylmalonyl-CoA epimerase